MSCSEAEHANLRRPKSKPVSLSDPIPKKNHSIFGFFSNSGSIKSNTSFNRKPSKKIKKLLTSVTLGGLGCGGTSSPAVIRSVAEWETKKLKKNKKKKKKKKKEVKLGSNVCCAPPGIGFAYDVAPIARIDSQRTNRRERSVAAARQNVNLEHASPLVSSPVALDTPPIRTDGVSDTRQFCRYRHSSRSGLPEILMFQHNSLLEHGNDQFGDWRLNVDTMSYEELLDLSDRIGYVGTGLQEDEIMLSVVKNKQSNSESLPLLTWKDEDWKCSICQSGCNEDEELGRLDCGHYHHINCIKQWLLHKNACPICKTAAVADKQG